MVGLFYIYLPMSWQIPTQVEQDIIAGKAKYQTFQTGNGGQSILQVPPNSFVVIFGYDFSPAGGGFKSLYREASAFNSGDRVILNDINTRWFETQQISFFTGNDFFPFIHHVDLKTTALISSVQNVVPGVGIVNNVTNNQVYEEIDNTPIARQVYITSTNDVAITHGLILNATPATTGAIPVTSRTPGFLTYGGSAQLIQAQTNYGPGATPLQFMQPSPKDFQDFGLGLLPGNPDNQAFATPDATNGLLAANVHLLAIGGDTFTQAAATNYYLCIHYALYSKTIPEQRG
jgi:hypothetical protein